MSLKQRLADELKEAMKNKNQLRKNVITMIRADVKQIEVDKRVELGDDEIIEIIAKQAKQRRDAIEEFAKGGREDLMEQAKQEVDILMEYLPEQLSEEEVEVIIREVITEIGATSMKEMGKIMAAAMPKLKGRADGKVVNQTVRKILQ
ncbi:GatB/YqeY domain-containing protein [Alkaliphilus oremlandii]|uniref:Putative tRNA binding protein n=1 Tax=Alkaliphilus oremlandii (strain OhILAs) TaxID=350688 RepID=A8MG58_ALKOO|nr:GatB/YqeY domain-containing protein [Alkaliphilus oremlandii]ABW18786.1 putative tRNA binding protein [Alkaliphilus oremlandii OhILAs]